MPKDGFSFAFRFLFCAFLRVCKFKKRAGILTCQVDVFETSAKILVGLRIGLPLKTKLLFLKHLN